jgi:hypothetical protein
VKSASTLDTEWARAISGCARVPAPGEPMKKEKLH